MVKVTPRPVTHVPASAQLDFVYGRFNLSHQWAVPYFTTAMTMRQAAESLRLVNDLPGNESLGWKIDELYQRDIDWGRVQHEIVPYLAGSEEPQFFNSLTIAFMPIRDNEIRQAFAGEGWAPPPLDGEYAKTLSVGPISVGYFQHWDSVEEAGARIGQIRWNTQQVFSVAIDGQHRLAAIKIAAKGFDERLDRSQVPVILLVLDERLGFRAPAKCKLVELMRNLFITLNKHAKTVSRPRQLLLDDNDPHSLCVRALVGERISDGGKELGSAQLPLSLVDWHSEQAKFEKGPYLTTILGLDWIVEKTLRTKPIKDYAQYGSVRKQLRAMSLSLGLNFHRPGSATFDRFVEIEKQAIEPFSYTGGWSHEAHEGELGDIVEAFRARWAPGLTLVLTQFKPYSNLISRRTNQPSLTSEFTNWYYLLQRKEQGERANDEYRNFVDRLRTRKDHPISDKVLEQHLGELEALKEDNLAFKVAFQRALISAFLEFAALESDDLPDVESEEDEDEESQEDASEDGAVQLGGGAQGAVVKTRATQFVKGLNRIVTSVPEFLDVKGALVAGGDDYIWQGSLYNRGADAIDFTIGASRRALDVIYLAATLALCADQKDEATRDGFDSFWESLAESDVGLHKRLLRSIENRFCAVTGAGGRIVQEKSEYSLEGAREEAKARARWLWRALDMPMGGGAKKSKKKSK